MASGCHAPARSSTATSACPVAPVEAIQAIEPVATTSRDGSRRPLSAVCRRYDVRGVPASRPPSPPRERVVRPEHGASPRARRSSALSSPRSTPPRHSPATSTHTPRANTDVTPCSSPAAPPGLQVEATESACPTIRAVHLPRHRIRGFTLTTVLERAAPPYPAFGEIIDYRNAGRSMRLSCGALRRTVPPRGGERRRRGARAVGEYTVRDHVPTGGFVADVLLFDRLVVPVPPEDEPGEWQRWIRHGWESRPAESVSSTSWETSPSASLGKRRDASPVGRGLRTAARASLVAAGLGAVAAV